MRGGRLTAVFAAALCLAAGFAAAAAPERQFAVPKPPFSPGIFPCSDCHKDIKPNPARRDRRETRGEAQRGRDDRSEATPAHAAIPPCAAR